MQWFYKVLSTTVSKGLVGLVGFWTVKGEKLSTVACDLIDEFVDNIAV